jgi:hypothetical protein
MTQTPTYDAGIDVAKDRLDVVLRPSGEYLEATNHRAGHPRRWCAVCVRSTWRWRYSKPLGGSSSPPPRPLLSPGCRWRSSSTPGR